jgi:hypothetical protein
MMMPEPTCQTSPSRQFSADSFGYGYGSLSLSAFMALRSFLSTGSGTALHFKKHNGPAVATQVFGQRCVKINYPSFILVEQSEFYGIYCCIAIWLFHSEV